jgi:hypothetical protein
MKAQKLNAEWLTVNRLAATTHAERRHVTKWMEIESVPCKQSGGRTVYERNEALAAIQRHQRAPANEAQPVDVDMGRLGATLEYYVDRCKLHRRMIAALSAGSQVAENALVKGELGLTEDQTRRLLVMLGEPWETVKGMIPADEIAAVEREGD